MDYQRPQGMKRPPDNGSEWYNEDARDGRHDYLKRDVPLSTESRTQRASQTGTFQDNHLPDEATVKKSPLGGNHGSEIGASVAKARSPKDWSKSSYPDRSFSGGRELGHSHRETGGSRYNLGGADIEDGSLRANYIDAASFGTANKITESVRFEIASNGLQDLPTGRDGQIISAGTPADNVGRFWGAPDGSCRSAMRGSVTNPRSNNHDQNILGSGIKQTGDDSIRVIEKVSDTLADSVVDDNHDGYAWLRQD
jgi:hypothetical protein